MRVRAFVVGSVAVVLLVGAGLVGVGYEGRGPLATRVGVTVTRVEPQGFRDPALTGDPLALVVMVRWPHEGFCSGQITASARESDREVRIGTVAGVEHAGGSCAGVGTLNGWAGVSVKLTEPLGRRSVVRDSDGRTLPLVDPWSS